jgi:hypothetical protein
MGVGKGGDTWGNRAGWRVRRSGTGKAKGREEWIGDLQGTEEGWIGGGRVGMSNSISPKEDKSKEKSEVDRQDGWT